jgi:hypothetical protein
MQKYKIYVHKPNILIFSHEADYFVITFLSLGHFATRYVIFELKVNLCVYGCA